MSVWLIVAIVLLLVVVVLFVLGTMGAKRHRRDTDPEFHAQLEEANTALAAARAEDRGWERANLERAARFAHAERHPEATISDLHLIQVVDRPGTDQDEARFRLVDDHGEHDILLGRRDGTWVEVD